MTTEIKDEDLALFQCVPAGTMYGIRTGVPVALTDYVFYSKRPNAWRLSAELTVHQMLANSDQFRAVNEAARFMRHGGSYEQHDKFKLSRIDIIGQNGNTGEHYALDRDQVVAAISEKLSVAGKAGLPYVLDAMQSAGLTVAVAASTAVAVGMED